MVLNGKWNHFYARQQRGALDIADRLNILIETGRDAFSMEDGMISKVSDGFFSVEYSTQYQWVGLHMPLYNTYCNITLEINDVVATSDINRAPFSYGDERNPFNIQSYIGIPLWIDDNLYGTIAFTASQARQNIFTERDKNFMRSIARSAERILR